jgi:hypothetical protein
MSEAQKKEPTFAACECCGFPTALNHSDDESEFLCEECV